MGQHTHHPGLQLPEESPGSSKGAHCVSCDNQIPWAPQPSAIQRGSVGLSMAVGLALEARTALPVPPARVGTMRVPTAGSGL